MGKSVRLALGLAAALAVSIGPQAEKPAQAQQQGFQVNRYEPTAAGEWSFWVDHPWYSSMRYFAAGITLNYAHNPLVFGRVSSSGVFSQTTAVIEHQLIGHVDLAGSFLDRVLLTASLPITFLEKGDPNGAGGVKANDNISFGDPRVGVMIRLFGQPYRSAISMSIGGLLWIPLRGLVGSDSSLLPPTGSDQVMRGMPKLVLGGLASHVMWSFSGGVMIRPDARIGTINDPAGQTAGTELQLGAAIAYASFEKRLAIGPEFIVSTALLNGNAFKLDYTSFEALLGIHYNIARILQLGIGGGIGVLRQPGTPDGRVLLRLAYAPMPGEKKAPEGPRDRDRDGVIDEEDLCPDVHKGNRPDPERLGCPVGDRDKDGVLDPDDKCPDEHKGNRPDPDRLGCPVGDRDKDGVLDPDDLCPDEHKGATPDPKRLGCPAGDRDKDGVLDFDDVCPDEHQGQVPDPARKGCPAPDRDKDTVVDPVDACPDKPGAPNPDPKKNGCPGLVEVKGGQIVIVKPVFFATNKDVILAKSFPVLQSVADALKASPQIKKVRVEGHTDDRGKVDYNVDLSDRRAKSVMKWLVEHGIEQGRLEAQGFGPKKPVAENKTEAGRAKNRRVDFLITDPPQPAGVQVQDAKSVEVPDSPDQSDGKKGGKKGAKAAPAKAAPAKAAPKGKKGKK